MLGGDTPGLAAISKTAHHQPKCPCKDCTQQAVRSQQRKGGLYLQYQPPPQESRKIKNRNGRPEVISTIRLRTKEDFIHLDPQYDQVESRFWHETLSW